MGGQVRGQVRGQEKGEAVDGKCGVENLSTVTSKEAIIIPRTIQPRQSVVVVAARRDLSPIRLCHKVTSRLAPWLFVGLLRF